MKSKQKIELSLFLTLLLAIICFRYYVLVLFGFKYTDSDQVVMWNALENYSCGQFHEPRFYGQAYNTMLEALLAVPLYISGIPPYKALPIITTLLSLFPFVLISILTFRKKAVSVSLIILSIPLFLPIEYHLITTLSRGFVSGIFVASIGLIALFYTNKKWAFLLLSFSTIIGYSITSNAILISLPCLLYLFLLNLKNINFYIYSAAGLLTGGSLHLWINYFYSSNPHYNLHQFKLSYSVDLLMESFNDLDRFFNHVSPLFWNQGFIWLLIFLLIGIILLWKKKFYFGLIMISIPIMLILPLGISKVHDGTQSIFFSSARMYLALPILIALSLTFIKRLQLHYLWFTIPFLFLFYHTLQLKDNIINNLNPKKNHVIAVAEVDQVLQKCAALKSISNKYEVELIVFINPYYNDLMNYGCSSCIDNFPKTLKPSYERRTWRLLEDEDIVYRNVLIIDDKTPFDEQFEFVESLHNSTDQYIITKNKLPTKMLLDTLNIKIRKYK